MKYYAIGIVEDGQFVPKAFVSELLVEDALTSLKLEYPYKEVKVVEIDLSDIAERLRARSVSKVKKVL